MRIIAPSLFLFASLITFGCCSTPEVVLQGVAAQKELLEENRAAWADVHLFLKDLLMRGVTTFVESNLTKLDLIERRHIEEARRLITQEYDRLARAQFDEAESRLQEVLRPHLEKLDSLKNDPTKKAETFELEAAIQEAVAEHNAHMIDMLFTWAKRRESDIAEVERSIHEDVEDAKGRFGTERDRLVHAAEVAARRLADLAKTPVTLLTDNGRAPGAATALPDVLIANHAAIQDYLTMRSATHLVWSGLAESLGVSSSGMNDVVTSFLDKAEETITGYMIKTEEKISNRINALIMRTSGVDGEI